MICSDESERQGRHTPQQKMEKVASSSEKIVHRCVEYIKSDSKDGMEDEQGL